MVYNNYSLDEKKCNMWSKIIVFTCMREEDNLCQIHNLSKSQSNLVSDEYYKIEYKPTVSGYKKAFWNVMGEFLKQQEFDRILLKELEPTPIKDFINRIKNIFSQEK